MEDHNIEQKQGLENEVEKTFERRQWKIIAGMMGVFAIESPILYATTNYFQSIFPGEVKAEFYAGGTTLLLCIPLAYLVTRIVTKEDK